MQEKIQEAIKKSSDFLEKQIRKNNYWLSCYDSNGNPTSTHRQGYIYAAYFITKALKGKLPNDITTILSSRILAEEYQNTNLWGFQKSDPENPTPYDTDADDTAYTLHACKNLNIDKPLDSLLRFYQNCDDLSDQNCIKGFKTFYSQHRAHLALQPALENNFGLHPEVNANVFTLLKNSNLHRYINPQIIIDSQSQEGFWYSYFYPSTYYSTYLFFDLLHGMDGFEQLKKKGLEYIRSSQNKEGAWGYEGNLYETSLALCSLAYFSNFDQVFRNGIEYLLQNQQPDGSWDAKALIYKWYNHDNKIWFGYDANNIVTTSLGTEALANFLVRLS